MKSFRILAVIALLVSVFNGQATIKGQPQRPRSERGIDPIITKARDEMNRWLNSTFKICPGGTGGKSVERYTQFNGRIINFSDLIFRFGTEPLSRLDEKDGVEFKGSIRLIRADYRLYDEKMNGWPRFDRTGKTFVSQKGLFPDVIKVEKLQGSSWEKAFDSSYKPLPQYSCGQLISGQGLSNRSDSPIVSSALVEVRQEVERYIESMFSKCDGLTYTLHRYNLTHWGLEEIKDLNLKEIKEDSVTAADSANGISWKGYATLTATIKREFKVQNLELYQNQEGWQPYSDVIGEYAFLTIQKINGRIIIRRIISNGDGSLRYENCAPSCQYLTAQSLGRVDLLQDIIKKKQTYLFDLLGGLRSKDYTEAGVEYRNAPHPLCVAFEKKVEDLKKAIKNSTSSGQEKGSAEAKTKDAYIPRKMTDEEQRKANEEAQRIGDEWLQKMKKRKP